MIPSRFYYPSPGFSIYWKSGNGKKLAKKLTGSFPGKGEIEQFIPRLFETDHFADQVIREVYQAHGFKQADAWIEALLTGETPVACPESLLTLVNQVKTVPAWLNPKLAEAGARLCRRSGPLGLMVLRNYCLMGGYESSAINKPLIFTGALKKGAAKRLTETTEFWIKIIGKNAITQAENGLKECLKVRLMHAYARVSIKDAGEWKSGEWGEPLNQWDMVATNLGFSIIYLDGLRKLGLKIREEEIQGLFHFWKYVGYLLGIPADYLPDNEPDAIRAIYAWTITQSPADSDTISLAKALLEEPLYADFPKKRWQKKLVLKLHLSYNHYFLGKASCKTMQLPNTVFKVYPFLVTFFVRIGQLWVHRSEATYQRSLRKNRQVQEKIVNMFLSSYGRDTIK